jgi:hypothetical protein
LPTRGLSELSRLIRSLFLSFFYSCDTTRGERIITGTASQIEWAGQIRPRVECEFQRVAGAFLAVAARQTEQDRADTLAVIAILEEKRVETMAHDHAGYFIRNWQELTDQVRQTIAADTRFQAIQANRKSRAALQKRQLA